MPLRFLACHIKRRKDRCFCPFLWDSNHKQDMTQLENNPQFISTLLSSAFWRSTLRVPWDHFKSERERLTNMARKENVSCLLQRLACWIMTNYASPVYDVKFNGKTQLAEQISVNLSRPHLLSKDGICL